MRKEIHTFDLIGEICDVEGKEDDELGVERVVEHTRHHQINTLPCHMVGERG